MLKLNMSALTVTLITGMLSGATQAATLTSLFANGGTFELGFFTPSPNVITGSSHNIVSAYNAPGWTVGTTQTGQPVSAITGFDFNGSGAWVNTFTAANSSQGTPGGGSTPSGTVNGANTSIHTGDVINVNLSSFLFS